MCLVFNSSACLAVSHNVFLLFFLGLEPCQALRGDENTCGVYVGTVRVYGEGGDALAVIRDYLDRDGSELIHQNLRRVFSVDLDGEVVTAAPEPESNGSTGISSSAIAGLAVALVTLSVGIVGLTAMQVSRRRNIKSRWTQDASSRSGSEVDECESVETVELQLERSLVVIERGRPKSIYFEDDGLMFDRELM